MGRHNERSNDCLVSCEDMRGSENVEEIKLKSCPLCGRKKLTIKTNRHVSHITCESCNLTLTRGTEKEAMQYWNKRVGQIDRIREIKRNRPKGFDKLTEEYRMK